MHIESKTGRQGDNTCIEGKNKKNVALRTQRKKGPGLRRCGDVVKAHPSVVASTPAAPPPQLAAAAAPGLPDMPPSPPGAHTDAESLRGREHGAPVSNTGVWSLESSSESAVMSISFPQVPATPYRRRRRNCPSTLTALRHAGTFAFAALVLIVGHQCNAGLR